MSSLVFPLASLPGAYIEAREPYDTVLIDESAAGNELRSTWSTYPRYRYNIKVNFLRSGAAFSELQKLAGFYQRHGGQLDSFLLDDPEDDQPRASSGTGNGSHYFAVGDGVTTAFQLQRTMVADADLAAAASRTYWPARVDGYEPIFDLNGSPTLYESGDWQGLRQLYSTARTNLCLQSQTLADASWTKTNLTDNGAVAAPDGTSTARKYTATASGSISRTVAGLTAGVQYIVSVWMRFDAYTTFAGTLVAPTLGTTEGSVTVTDATPAAWTRVSFTFTAAGASTVLSLASILSGNVIEMWGFQLEAGSVTTSYIPTISAASTITDYTLASGAVTLAVAPLAAALLSWTGSFYRRCRFDQPNLNFARLVKQVWSSGLKLVSVK